MNPFLHLGHSHENRLLFLLMKKHFNILIHEKNLKLCSLVIFTLSLERCKHLEYKMNLKSLMWSTTCFIL